MFEHVTWQRSRLLMNDLVFRLEPEKTEDWDLGDEGFVLFKDRSLLDEYEQALAEKNGFAPQNIFELGIWEGGSVAFWFECFKPKKYVAVDLNRKEDSKYFRRYVAARGLEQRLKTYWGTDQADRARLREIVAREFDGPLDLVIDDASHLYGPTKASFEVLFPLLRPGGLYAIEDWAWDHMREYDGDRFFGWTAPMTQMVAQLIEAAGSAPSLIRNVRVSWCLVLVERGEMPAADVAPFALERVIYHRRRPSLLRHGAFVLARGLYRLLLKRWVRAPGPAGRGAAGVGVQVEGESGER